MCVCVCVCVCVHVRGCGEMTYAAMQRRLYVQARMRETERERAEGVGGSSRSHKKETFHTLHKL